jgi:hypothetical protein
MVHRVTSCYSVLRPHLAVVDTQMPAGHLLNVATLR